MLKLRVQTGNTVKIGADSAIQLLAIDGHTALFRIGSADFYSVILHTSEARKQQVFSSECDEQLATLPEGSSVHFAHCTVLLKSITPNAAFFVFMAPRSVVIDKSKDMSNEAQRSNSKN